jgi:hypothetical protein
MEVVQKTDKEKITLDFQEGLLWICPDQFSIIPVTGKGNVATPWPDPVCS